jgi:precorrin-6Y C5,15-methyltransferase (decarboxylating)
VLTGPGCGPADIGVALDGWDRRLVVAEHLGSDAERLTECSPADAARRTWADPNVALVLAGSPASPRGQGKVMNAAFITEDEDERHIHHERQGAGAGGQADVGWPEGTDGQADAGVAALGWLAGAPGAPDGWALPEEQFDSRDAVMTKAEVRALALARLGPGPGMLAWDVGAGSGSVGIECARFGAAVIAVERDAVRCERVRANASRHGVDVRIVPGEAPGALAKLPDPDAVFVGGGGPAVLEAVAARRPARIVVALAAVERAGQAIAALTAAGYATDGALVQAARFAPLPGDVHRLAATNPVFLVWATAGPGATEPVSPAGPQPPGPGATETSSPRDSFGPGTRGTGPGAAR